MYWTFTGWEGLYPKVKSWFTGMCDLQSCQKAVSLVLENGDTSLLKVKYLFYSLLIILFAVLLILDVSEE